jgi:23S rRNA pseudouridine1911/1915/1917 synthase
MVHESYELVGEPGRLDAVVARLIGARRADVQRAITAGNVTVDGEIKPKAFPLRGGESIVAVIAGPGSIEPDGPPVPVRYRDDDLVVVAKPAGRSGTLVNSLLAMGVQLAPAGGELRPGIVHRLDVGTSGLMVVAETDRAYAALGRAARGHALDRRYLALVRGEPNHATFSVEAPLGRRAARIVVDRTEGRPAETWFEVRERLRTAALVEAAPRTGRTHQIRVHLRSIGHPILGDGAYGGAGEDARRLGLARPFLHSWRLAFDHPFSGERIEVEEPLPPDLERALVAAREPAGDDAPDLQP